MTAIEAIIYCLGYVSDVAEDGYYLSAMVWDRQGSSHWIAWAAQHGDAATPEFQSEHSLPFAAAMEPYRVTANGKDHPF